MLEARIIEAMVRLPAAIAIGPAAVAGRNFPRQPMLTICCV
jgi:hypothetical protein